MRYGQKSVRTFTGGNKKARTTWSPAGSELTLLSTRPMKQWEWFVFPRSGHPGGFFRFRGAFAFTTDLVADGIATAYLFTRLKTAVKNRSIRSPMPGLVDSRFPAQLRTWIWGWLRSHWTASDGRMLRCGSMINTGLRQSSQTSSVVLAPEVSVVPNHNVPSDSLTLRAVRAA